MKSVTKWWLFINRYFFIFFKKSIDKLKEMCYNKDTKEREAIQMKIFVATNKHTEEEIRTPYLFEMIDTIKALGEKYGDKFSDWEYKVEKTS